MTFDQAFINSAGLIFLTAFLTFLAAAFWNAHSTRKARAAALAEAASTMSGRVKDLETQLATLTATFTPISEAFKAVLIKQLTHFHAPEMDELLVRAEKNTLSGGDWDRLKMMLLERAEELDGRIDESEREAALMLPFVMNRVRRGAAVSDSEVMVVLVPKDKVK